MIPPIEAYMSDANVKIAYVHPMAFPSTEANTFDAVWTASALSEEADTTFFVPRMKTSEARLRHYYDVTRSPMRFQTMYLNYLPDRFLLAFHNFFERALATHIRFHPSWAFFRGLKVLCAREPRELLFWGQEKERQPWLKNWILFYEAHDPLGIDPASLNGSNPFEVKEGAEGELRRKILNAAVHFDAIICNTQILADDIKMWSSGRIHAHVITLSSPLPRLSEPPVVPSFGNKVVVGYIGTIDCYRGVDILLEAMRLLPNRFNLRLVGRVRKEKGVDPNWLDHYMRDQQIGPKVDLNLVDSIDDVAAEIDRCDIVIQPASTDVLDSRYAAPLKSYGYMMRGKPIVAGDVLCHRELFRDGESAALYELNPESLASQIVKLSNNPEFATIVARRGWEQSTEYMPSRRAGEILSLAKALSRA